MNISNVLFTVLYLIALFSIGSYLWKSIHEKISLLCLYRDEDLHKITNLEIKLANIEERRFKHYTPKKTIKKRTEERNDNPRGSKKIS